MLHNALTSSSPYADLWSHFKAIQHAIERAIDIKASSPLTDLDHERLDDLVSFLRENCDSPGEDAASIESLMAMMNDPSLFTIDIDIKECLMAASEFSSWLEKTRFDKKVARLISSIEKHIELSKESRYAKPSPPREFSILLAFLDQLLIETQPIAHI